MICDICGEQHKGFYNVPKRHNKYGEITSWKLVCRKCYGELKNEEIAKRRSAK